MKNKEILGHATEKQLEQGRKKLKTYVCYWPECGHEFQQYVGTARLESKHSIPGQPMGLPGGYVELKRIFYLQ